MLMPTIKLDGWVARSSSEDGATVILTFSQKKDNMHSFTVEARHRNHRHAVIHATLKAMGRNPRDVDVAKDILDLLQYEIELILTTEAWIKTGRSITLRNPEQLEIETIVNGVMAAVCNAEQDPRPKKRRLP